MQLTPINNESNIYISSFIYIYYQDDISGLWKPLIRCLCPSFLISSSFHSAVLYKCIIFRIVLKPLKSILQRFLCERGRKLTIRGRHYYLTIWPFKTGYRAVDTLSHLNPFWNNRHTPFLVLPRVRVMCGIFGVRRAEFKSLLCYIVIS